MREQIEQFLNSWFQSLQDPASSQAALLERLLPLYARTDYGKENGAERVTSWKAYQEAFPIVTYRELLPYIEKVKRGWHSSLLPEPPVEWALTRGTTGRSKYIPLTASDLAERVRCGPRGLLNYVVRNRRPDILQGGCLNLNFPSVVDTVITEQGEKVNCGYSSGIYARHNAREARLKLFPSQDKIDSLGKGMGREDWERRFELAYREAKGERLTMAIGVTQTLLKFGRFVRKKYGLYPKELWDIPLLICTSTPGIHGRYLPALKGLFGRVAVVEMYGATEGMYAQQLDEMPYLVPNYDYYGFEVDVRGRIKMLYQLKKGEYGSLIISSVLFPRYRIGDIIRSYGGHYYRILGRERPFPYLRYLAAELFPFV